MFLVWHSSLGKCRVTYNGQIITFDEAKFGYNLTSCYHLIAEDCSVSQNFSVLSRTDSTYGATAKVQCYFWTHFIFLSCKLQSLIVWLVIMGFE